MWIVFAVVPLLLCWSNKAAEGKELVLPFVLCSFKVRSQDLVLFTATVLCTHILLLLSLWCDVIGNYLDCCLWHANNVLTGDNLCCIFSYTMCTQTGTCSGLVKRACLTPVNLCQYCRSTTTLWIHVSLGFFDRSREVLCRYYNWKVLLYRRRHPDV